MLLNSAPFCNALILIQATVTMCEEHFDPRKLDHCIVILSGLILSRIIFTVVSDQVTVNRMVKGISSHFHHVFCVNNVGGLQAAAALWGRDNSSEDTASYPRACTAHRTINHELIDRRGHA